MVSPVDQQASVHGMPSIAATAPARRVLDKRVSRGSPKLVTRSMRTDLRSLLPGPRSCGRPPVTEESRRTASSLFRAGVNQLGNIGGSERSFRVARRRNSSSIAERIALRPARVMVCPADEKELSQVFPSSSRIWWASTSLGAASSTGRARRSAVLVRTDFFSSPPGPRGSAGTCAAA